MKSLVTELGFVFAITSAVGRKRERERRSVEIEIVNFFIRIHEKGGREREK